MNRNTVKGPVIWALPVGSAAGLLILSLPLIAYTPNAEFPLVFVVIPLLCITLLALLLIASIRKRKRLQVSAAITLAAVIAVSFTVLRLQQPIRQSLRWLL